MTPVFPRFSHVLQHENIQVVVDALSSITDVNIISSPTLMVLDNKKATLQVGNEVPIVTQSAVAVLMPGSPIVNSVTYRNTGIVLSITPRVGDNGRILLEVEQEASDVVRTDTSGIDSPTIQQRRIKTTVAVNDGESIILGGLIQDRADNKRDQVPLVGEVPRARQSVQEQARPDRPHRAAGRDHAAHRGNDATNSGDHRGVSC